MSLERPKILTEIEVSANQTLNIYIDPTGTPPLGPIQATINSGTYFLAWDTQADDYLYQVTSSIQSAVQLEGTYGSALFWASIDATTHKITIEGSNIGSFDFQIDWTAEDGATIGGVLGANVSAAQNSSQGEVIQNRTMTMAFHHGYGWYADEDGYLMFKPLYDHTSSQVKQSITMAGNVATLKISDDIYGSALEMFAMTEEKTWSNGKGYATTPHRSYTKNEALECWWYQAIQGKRFRIYRNETQDLTRAYASGTRTSGSTTQVTASAAAFTVDDFIGMLLYIDDYNGSNIETPQRWYITDNDANQIDVSNNTGNLQAGHSDSTIFYVMDGLYDTYVLDADAMQSFEPEEIPALNRFSIAIPLRRYVA